MRVDQASGEEKQVATGSLEKAGALDLRFDATTPDSFRSYRAATPFADEAGLPAYGVKFVERARAGTTSLFETASEESMDAIVAMVAGGLQVVR